MLGVYLNLSEQYTSSIRTDIPQLLALPGSLYKLEVLPVSA